MSNWSKEASKIAINVYYFFCKDSNKAIDTKCKHACIKTKNFITKHSPSSATWWMNDEQWRF